MEDIKQRYSKSVMSYITISLTAIIALALLSIFVSFWTTELADKDAQAINLSGSMRMQTYRIGLSLHQGNKQQVEQQIKKLDETWKNPIFLAQNSHEDDSELNNKFYTAFSHWEQTLKPLLRDFDIEDKNFPDQSIIKQVQLTDDVVHQFQVDAERKIQNLRTFQSFAFFITIIVGSLIFYLLKNRVEKPLHTLTYAAHNIGKGDFSTRVEVNGQDELALFSAVFNQTCESIDNMYSDLEGRFNEKTIELRQNNITLGFLFNAARKILDSQNSQMDYQGLLDELSDALELEELELCLFTEVGSKPYLHLAPTGSFINNCENRACENCKGDGPFVSETPGASAIGISYRYPINVDHGPDKKQYGVINYRPSTNKPLDDWQNKLLHSVADQLAIAISLQEQKQQERRLALLSERTVIARELHDSLAQALSYLQIQVLRLQKSKDAEKYDLQQPIIDEIREGLSSAYRQLRELLTTFRLKVGDGGLKAALENTVEQLLERSNMKVNLNYQLGDVPLTPFEEIHLLQIIREGSQNAINHSKGDVLNIELIQQPDQSIHLLIQDDGVGMPDNPEKLNHYGLAIMQERSKQLNGEIQIESSDGGTKIDFNFWPDISER